MARILALDLGKERTGFAITDEEQIIAQAMPETVKSSQVLASIKKILENYEVEEIVVGLPKNMAGEEGAQAEWARKLGELIHKNTGLPIIYIDERLTTKQVNKMERDRKIPVDALVAQQLLEEYLRKK